MSDKKDLADMTLKEKFQLEMSKLKGMSFKDKCGYIWEYYKILLGSIVLLIIIVVGIVEVYNSNKFKEVFYTAFLNTAMMDGTDTDIINGFEQYLNIDPKKEKVVLDLTMSIDPDTEDTLTVNSNMKMTTIVAAKQLDLIIMPEYLYERYLGMGMLSSLEDLLSQEMLDKLDPYLYKGEDLETMEGGTYAIDLSGSSIIQAESAQFPEQPMIAAIVANSERKETAVQFIEYLFQE